MAIQSTTLKFLFLNLQRVLSIAVLLMTFSAIIFMMVLDAREVDFAQQEYSNEELDECEVYPVSTNFPRDAVDRRTRGIIEFLMTDANVLSVLTGN